ncbi:glycoside hydrolase family 97 catalytic domain-containing protein [Haloarcula nitratireducens]|uniref:Glycoside hydrolase family 97 catalytic domain-containing protein n=1 Tax=Haloarcula nitratireducens TaxID=2487749 RepID=A0AAW4PDG9_9EURY|nr:glycoside hydrolase family 97 catalytic domain-containing protein [Halomicroarcula nitratireducens]MBX0296027.1 glycoside hydrolase family 97 catalytic domain-containing protein [Halomicroarcula nitratireducens]
MSEDRLTRSSAYSRRQFVGGLASLLAAATFSREVSAATAEPVTSGDDSATQTVTSPDDSIAVTVDVGDGVPTYSVSVDGTTYVTPSELGFDFQNQQPFGASADGDGTALTVSGSERGSEVERWDPIWDQYDSVREEYNYLRVGLEEEAIPGRQATLELRVFDDGLGFRVVFPEVFGNSEGDFVITSENTAFNFADDYTSWWIENRFAQPEGEPGRFEAEYQETPLSEIASDTEEQIPGGAPTREGAHTPLTIEADDVYLSVHEADLTDYATLSIAPDVEGGTDFSAELAPLPDGTRVSAEAPHVTPWRTVQVGSTPGDLVESSLIPLLNDDLNEDALPADGDTDWIEPKKYVGIWWLMIAGSANWQYKTDEEIRNSGNNPASYIHGARTERMKRYLQFASQNSIDSVLAEGWNQGWDTYPGDGTGLEMGVDDSYPDFDLFEITDYGANLDPATEFTIHNETAGNVVNYEEQIRDGIFAGYDDEGIHSIKNGYVSNRGLGFEGDGSFPTHNHHSQLAVNHHEFVAREAMAERQLLERHEADKPTGKHRTYPNRAATETVKAQEYDGFGALGSDVDEDHHVTLPFTRMLAGPMSYQPGIFDITFNDSTGGRIQTTRAKQLAMYPTYHAGIQMAADRIEAYVSPEFEVGELLQATSGELDGMITADDWRNAFGGHYVPVDPNSEPSGASVSFTVRDVPEAGEYDLHLRYASDAEENAQRVKDAGGPQATLSVDGDMRTINPEFTEYWDQWEIFTTTVSLSAGDNTVAVELNYEDSGGSFEGDVGGFNLNTVAVTEAGEPSPVPAEFVGYTPENENFDTVPEFDFLEAVPAGGWDDTEVVDAAIADYSVTARKKDDEWFLGAMTDEEGRAIDVPLSFLSPGDGEESGRGNGRGNGKSQCSPGNGRGSDGGRGPRGPKYVAEIYTDGIGAGNAADATEVEISEAIVDPSATLLASMARSGGTAVRFRRAEGREIRDLPEYERPTQEFDVAIDSDLYVQEPFVTATGENDSAFIGGTNVELVVDGDVVSNTNVRLPPNSSDVTVEFDYTIDSPGDYDVVVRRADGTVLASSTVTVQPPETVDTISDPLGDDYGPGGYTYPAAEADFKPGAFDLRSFTVNQTPSFQQYAFEVENLTQVFGGRFSPQMFVCWIRDPDKSGGSTTSLDDLGANVEFEEEWHYRLRVDGFNLDLVNANGGAVLDDDGNAVTPRVATDFEGGTVTLGVDSEAFDGADAADLEVVPMVQSEDRGTLRPVDVTNEDYVFGGAKDGAVDNAPLVMDLITPEGVDQTDALAYSDAEKATLPFVSLGE